MGKTPRNDRDGVNQTWKALTKAGYVISVEDGEGTVHRGLKRKEAIAEVMSCDDGYFIAHYSDDPDGDRAGWVRFVFGNDPEEVICDYTTTLEHVIGPLTDGWIS